MLFGDLVCLCVVFMRLSSWLLFCYLLCVWLCLWCVNDALSDGAWCVVCVAVVFVCGLIN